MDDLSLSLCVMAGLGPAIHGFSFALPKHDVDARHKAGHDGKAGTKCQNRNTRPG
jgi:hypothetical protein